MFRKVLLRQSLTARFLFAVASATLFIAPATSEPSATEKINASRPLKWARSVALNGVPNLHQVSAMLYRSAQPEKQGFRNLAGIGVKTNITLRAIHRDEKLIQGLGIEIISIPMHTWHIEREDVVAALRAIRAAEKQGPVLLHCQHGADRTGLISALYRIVFEGWTKEAALAEMLEGRFGYHVIWGNIPTYINKVDIEALKRDVGAL